MRGAFFGILLGSMLAAAGVTAQEGIPNAKTPTAGVLFGGQPTGPQLQELKGAGYVTVIDLRMPEEDRGYDEAALAGELELMYHLLPVGSDTLSDPETYQRFFDLFANADRPVVVHCGSGNRVGAMYYAYLVAREGIARDEALTAARAHGLTSDQLAEAINAYLDQQAEPPAEPAAAPAPATGGTGEHGIVFFGQGRFAGWPANHGIWSWGDEIVVGFLLGNYKAGEGHPIDRDGPQQPRFARSKDGGATWSIERPNYLDENGNEPEPRKLDTPMDFSLPDFAMQLRGGNFYYSNDRCRTWAGPFALPVFGRDRLMARTDYLIEGRHEALAFLTATKDDGQEGWPFCMRTRDGGQNWSFIGWIGPQPETGGYAIQPSTVRVSDEGLLTVIRRRARTDGDSRWWMEAHLSPDEGASWYLLAEPVIDNAGNPPHVIRLRDDRLVMTYGHRHAPHGVRARVSDDDGVTWGEEIVLRDDGGGWDLGYPRTVQRTDGKLVTVYYFNDATRNERYIAFTIWGV